MKVPALRVVQVHGAGEARVKGVDGAKRSAAALAAVVAFCAIALPGPALAGSSPSAELRPLNLGVEGGADSWHSVNDFRLDWDHPQSGGRDVPVAKIHLRILDTAGNDVRPEIEIDEDGTVLSHIHVPGRPGNYRAELWFEGPGGEVGEPANTALLFDDARPAPARPVARRRVGSPGDTAAIGEARAPGRASGRVSGIRGYAVSVDRGAGQPPLRAGRNGAPRPRPTCHGGIGDDEIALEDCCQKGLTTWPCGGGLGLGDAVGGTGDRDVIRVDATGRRHGLERRARRAGSSEPGAS